MSETQTAATTDAAETDDTEKPDVKTTEGAEQTEAKGEGEGDKPETEADADPKPKPTPWWDKRIAVLTAKNASAEQMLAEANARLAALEGRPTVPAQPNGEMTEAEFNRRVEERAAQKAAQNAHATRLQLMIETGNKEFTPAEFTAKSNTLAGLGATENAAFMAELTDSENGHKIVAYLGDHPEEAERMLALPSNRIAREMTKLITIHRAAKASGKIGTESQGSADMGDEGVGGGMSVWSVGRDFEHANTMAGRLWKLTMPSPLSPCAHAGH